MNRNEFGPLADLYREITIIDGIVKRLSDVRSTGFYAVTVVFHSERGDVSLGQSREPDIVQDGRIMLNDMLQFHRDRLHTLQNQLDQRLEPFISANPG